jgi:hypothetical protein
LALLREGVGRQGELTFENVAVHGVDDDGDFGGHDVRRNGGRGSLLGLRGVKERDRKFVRHFILFGSFALIVCNPYLRIRRTTLGLLSRVLKVILLLLRWPAHFVFHWSSLAARR